MSIDTSDQLNLFIEFLIIPRAQLRVSMFFVISRILVTIHVFVKGNIGISTVNAR